MASGQVGCPSAVCGRHDTLERDVASRSGDLRLRAQHSCLAVGQERHRKAESAIRGERAYPPTDDQAEVVALAVDSAWLRHRLTCQEKE